MSDTTTTTESSAAQTTEQTSPTTEAAAATTTTTEAPFYDAWAEDLKNSPSVLRYKSAEEIARAYVNAEKKLGWNPDQLLRAPKGLDDKDGIGAIMKALGAPDSADGYKLELAEGAGEADLAMARDFAQHMFAETQAPPFVVKAAVEWFNKQTADAAAAAEAANAQAMKDGEAALRAEWGAAYDTRMKEVGRLMNEHGAGELYAEMEKNGLANSPKLLSMFGKLLDRMAEPGDLPGNGRGSDPVALTPGQAKAKRLELEADPIKSKALYDSSHPQHAAVVEERRGYFKLERGEQA